MKKILFPIVALFSTGLLWAQEKTVDINVNTGKSNWYASPWIWVVGAAVFILLLVALTRGGRRD